MNRKEFIIKSGAMFTVAALMPSAVFGESLEMNDADKTNKQKRPDPDNCKQPIVKAIAVGLNAPSPHNTQSWKFRVINDNEMDFFVDENILLPATDPPSRQIHMGAGSFIETLCIGVSRYGFKASVSLFPEGYETELDFGRKPIAHIKVQPSTEGSHALAHYIERRQTSRLEYKGPMVSEAEFKTLLNLSGESHSKLFFRNTELDRLKDVFYKGLDIEMKTRAANEETRLLFRFSEEERKQKGDGLSIPQMGYKGLGKYIVEMATDNGNPEKWHSLQSIEMAMKKIGKAIDSTKGVVYWVTETNTFKDWVQSGKDFVRFSLALTSKGMYSHPYNQAIQEYAEMDSLRNELNTYLGIEEPRKIQMIVRIGRSAKPYYSYRRPLEGYLQ